LVIALIPTDGTEKAVNIHKQDMVLLKMAARLNLKILVMAADRAAPELATQELMDQEKTELPALTYEYPLYIWRLPHSPSVQNRPFNLSNRLSSFA